MAAVPTVTLVGDKGTVIVNATEEPKWREKGYVSPDEAKAAAAKAAAKAEKTEKKS